MKTLSFLSLLLLSALLAGAAHAQSTPYVPPNSDNPPYVPPPSPPKPHVSAVQQPDQAPAGEGTSDEHLDPAKVTDFQKRFAEGNALQKQGKLAEARAIYDGILADDPNAKGSLLEAGETSFKLGDLTRADGYLEKLHSLVPNFPGAIEMLIQINQALKRDVKVELLLRDFRDLHDSGKIPDLTQSIYFVRERFQDSGQNIIVSQFFDYTKDPNTVWMAEVFGSDGELKRRLLLNFDPQATKALRAKDAKYANTQVFTWFEHVIKDGKVTAINAYMQIFALPDYAKFRSAMLYILANPTKPAYSVPVDDAQH